MKRYERLVRLDTCLERIGRKQNDKKSWMENLAKQKTEKWWLEREKDEWRKKSQFIYCKQMSFDCIWNSKFYSLSLVTSQSGGDTIQSFHHACCFFLFAGPFSLNSQWSCEEHFNQMGTLTIEEEASRPASHPTNQPVYYIFISFETFLFSSFDIDAHMNSKTHRTQKETECHNKNKRINNVLRQNAMGCACNVCPCVHVCTIPAMACGSRSQQSVHAAAQKK